jgi:hypothetical protein
VSLSVETLGVRCVFGLATCSAGGIEMLEVTWCVDTSAPMAAA